MQFDQYSCLANLLNIFQFSPKIIGFCPKFQKLIWTLKNVFHYLVELVETNLLIYNTLQFDQYSRLSILLKIVWFSVANLKKNSKFEKGVLLLCRACWDKSIEIYHQRFRIKMKYSDSFEGRRNRLWYRLNRFQNVLSKTFQLTFDTHFNAEN